MSAGPSYEIRGVWDFLDVPKERRDECLREFACALEMAEGMRNLIKSAAAVVTGRDDAVKVALGPVFRWVDDGKRTATLRISTPKRAP